MHTKSVFVILTLVGFLITSALACGDSQQKAMLDLAQDDLDSHRTLWEKTRSSDYTYKYTLHCTMCLRKSGEAVKVTIKNGDIESVVYAESGKPAVAADLDQYVPIDDLFDTIQDAINHEVEHLSVSYDPEFGYPKHAEIDYFINGIDDESTFMATAYSPH